MRRVTRIVLMGLGLTTLSLAGCFNGHEIITQRAANEFRCPAGQVQVEELGGNAYRVWACGSSATYACSARMGMCLKEPGGQTASGQGMPQGGPQPPPVTTFGQPQVDPAAPPPGVMPTAPAPMPEPPSPWGTP
jgi:hypothetical protein